MLLGSPGLARQIQGLKSLHELRLRDNLSDRKAPHNENGEQVGRMVHSKGIHFVAHNGEEWQASPCP